MTRLWVLTAVLLALALAGCRPGCNDSGSSRAQTIRCVTDPTSTDIYRCSHCSPTGQPLAP